MTLCTPASAAAAAAGGSLTQQGVREVGDFIRRLDAFAVCLDLDRHVTRAASLHDVWFREMYIEHRYGG